MSNSDIIDILYGKGSGQEEDFFFDLSITEEDLPVEGWHVIHVDKVTFRKSKKGDPMLAFQGTISGGASDGRIVFWNVMLGGSGKGIGRRMLSGVGAPIRGSVQQLVEFFQDKFIVGRVRHKTNNDGELTYDFDSWKEFNTLETSLEV